MNQETPDNRSGQRAVMEAIEDCRSMNLEDALPVFEQNLHALSTGTMGDRRIAASAFSYYGICMAKIRRKFTDAVKYCNISIRANPLDPDHRANLALVYLERNNRSKALGAISAGLRLDRQHRRLIRLRDSIGRRKNPVLPFLSRDNPVNIWLGKWRAGRGR